MISVLQSFIVVYSYIALKEWARVLLLTEHEYRISFLIMDDRDFDAG